MPTLQLTVLGSGTSMGVPTLACHCAVCESADPMDKRMRPSVLLEYGGRSVVIDTTPDFRSQAMRAKLDRLDALLYTHGHADHILGLDDVRPYNAKQRSTVPIYASSETLATLRRQFAYIFDGRADGQFPAANRAARSGRPVRPFRRARDSDSRVPRTESCARLPPRRRGLSDGFQPRPRTLKELCCAGLDHFILDALRYDRIRCTQTSRNRSRSWKS